MIVENVTKVEGPVIIKNLQKAHVRSQTTTFVLQAVVFACGLLMLILGLVGKQTPNIAMGTVFIILGFIYIAYTVNRLNNEKKQIETVNQTVLEHGCTYNYKFKQESIFCDFIAGPKHQKFECKYTDVKKINEYSTKYEFILYDHTILYADKAGFENEKMIEFFKKNIAFNKKKIKLRKD